MSHSNNTDLDELLDDIQKAYRIERRLATTENLISRDKAKAILEHHIKKEVIKYITEKIPEIVQREKVKAKIDELQAMDKWYFSPRFNDPPTTVEYIQDRITHLKETEVKDV